MRFFQDKRGFTLVELMIAAMVLLVGLTGVAAMQLTALKGTFAANSNSTGAGIALAWSEWLDGLMNHTDQPKNIDPVTGMWFRQNLISLNSLDSNQNDTAYTEYQLPSSTDEIVKCFNGQQAFVSTTGYSKTVVFIKVGSQISAAGTTIPIPFTAADMPPPAPEGSHLVLRIAANVPVINTCSVEVSLPYTNAFSKKTGATLHFVVSSNM